MKEMKSIIFFIVIIAIVTVSILVQEYINKEYGDYDAKNYINSVMMDVYVNSDGSASITEKWDTILYNGTKLSKSYKKLENNEIGNFRVEDNKGNSYTILEEWDKDKSYTQEAYKCGIVKSGNTTDLYWSISEYGNNIYTISYDVTNFINQYSDGQGINFNFMTDKMNPCPSNVIITIRSEIPFNEENSKIWSFDCEGATIKFDDGKIVMDSNNSFTSSKQMVVLALWNEKLFDATNIIHKTLDQVKDEINEENNNEEQESNNDSKEFGGQYNPKGRALYNNIVNSIEYYIYISNDGTAKVNEKWNVEAKEGDELYRIYPIQRNNDISNLQMTDETGAVYEVYNSWDYIATSIELKKNRCALISRGGENEIIWGIGEYGNRTYSITYDLKNFVEQYKDGQGILFRFLPRSTKNQLGYLNNVKIVISSDVPLTEDNCDSRLVDYNNGIIKYENGNIVVEKLDSDGQYIGEIIFQTFFKDNICKISKTEDITKQEITDALDNVLMEKENKKNDDSNNEIPDNVILLSCMFALAVFIVLIGFIIIKKISRH